ncbi:MAG: MBL fold metallo-hydrolase [Acidimicrobiales bacterium]
MISLKFYGVRGSYPVVGDQFLRFGGETSCCVIREAHGDQLGPPIVFDLGSGAIALGRDLVAEGVQTVTAFLTHLHWDHIQGLPFFAPLDAAGAHVEVVVPAEYGDVEEVVIKSLSPPLFPVSPNQRPGQLTISPSRAIRHFEDPFCSVTALSIPHTNPTVGLRLDTERSSIAFVTDHQIPKDGRSIHENVAQLCDGVDLLIHDAQFVASDLVAKGSWGHATAEYALHVAASTGAKRLALYHHDPSRTDRELDVMMENLARLCPSVGLMAARAGMEILLP